MARTALFPSLLASALVAGAAYAAPAPQNPAEAWIARIEAPELQPAQPVAADVGHDAAQAFLARFDAPVFSPAQVSKAVADSHPDRDFIARLSTGGSAVAEEAAPQSAPYSVVVGK